MFKNLHELLLNMPTEKDCRNYLIEHRWGGCPVCPYCGFSEKTYVIENGKRFKCGASQDVCGKKYSVTVGTIFESSRIPLTKWLNAIYVVTAHKKGISSHQLGRDLGVTQRTAWFMIHRIREMMKNVSNEMLQGAVEVDETYMSRKYKSDYKGLSPEEVDYSVKSHKNNKGAVVGIKQREGDIRVFAFDDRKAAPIKQAIYENVMEGSKIMTDEAFMYRTGLEQYQHAAVFHSRKEWVRNDVHTNGVENFWGVMKRSIHGTWHQISFKHLQAYCNECSYRYNTRKMKDAERFTLSLQNMERRLTWQKLTKKD
ncbi:MAG TPA: IS1595 family transposase [Sediminibacterium sp.]|nr:IS1595 family transposase [Sediminibacterium sp.]